VVDSSSNEDRPGGHRIRERRAAHGRNRALPWLRGNREGEKKGAWKPR